LADHQRSRVAGVARKAGYAVSPDTARCASSGRRDSGSHRRICLRVLPLLNGL